MAARAKQPFSLEQVLNTIFAQLERGAERFRDPFHQAALSTRTHRGTRSRMVILRGALRERRRLVCFSDVRAEKIKEIQAHPGVCWLFYNPRSRVQLRLEAEATVHADDHVADEYWCRTPLASRINYATENAPGTRVSQPTRGLTDKLLETCWLAGQTERFRANFCVIETEILVIDWLQLGLRGHQRAGFHWTQDQWIGSWLVP